MTGKDDTLCLRVDFTQAKPMISQWVSDANVWLPSELSLARSVTQACGFILVHIRRSRKSECWPQRAASRFLEPDIWKQRKSSGALIVQVGTGPDLSGVGQTTDAPYSVFEFVTLGCFGTNVSSKILVTLGFVLRSHFMKSIANEWA